MARTGRVGRLDLNRRKSALRNLYQHIESSLESGRTATRAEEWLLDNRHVIEDALSTLATDLPAGYLRSLPHVESGSGGRPLPRIRELATVLVESAGDPIDLSRVEQTVENFQDSRKLTIGELWALPAFLDLGIIDRLLEDSQRLGTGDAGTLSPDETELTDRIAGAVISLRTLAAHDWRDSFEALSRVNRILSGDPADAFTAMDFESRNRYREVIERLARHGASSETEVAETCITLCRQQDPDQQRRRHVGYWLIGRGRVSLEQQVGYRAPVRERLRRFALAFPGISYFSLLMLFVAVPTSALLGFLAFNTVPGWLTGITLLLALIPVTGLAVAMINGLITWRLPPRTLARLALEEGIPDTFRTAVAVPVIFSDRDDVDQVFERLESNFLANDDQNLVYVVLGDLRDSDQPEHPGDRRILGRVEYHMRRLGARHGSGRFLFLCRQRRWNDGEGCWMGWERKRGKLMEFNRLLAGRTEQTSFETFIGERSLLEGVRYVITLDADTRMPPGAARQLVGTLAHPLSHAVPDREHRTLKAGFGIIQPRLEVDPDTTSLTRFTRIFSGDVTIDLYSHASSDVYHDLFGEGIFTGKGIYDWRALEFALGERIPDNTLLSHDLLEGVHARVGLASDIVLMEQFPSSVVAFMRRQHRWVRGDWQLLPWLRRRVRMASGERQPNPLKWIHHWKIVDNLRRSLQPPAVLALLFVALSGLLPGHDWLWLLIMAALLATGLITELLDVIGRCLTRPGSAWMRLRAAPAGMIHQFRYWLLSLVLLPYQSYILLDAIVRTITRMMITRRHLLEWTTAAHMQQRLSSQRSSRLWIEIWSAPACGVAAAILVGLFNPGLFPAAVIVIVGWLLAPLVVEYVDRTEIPELPSLDPAGRELLRNTARRTWLFFDRFVGPDTHWLPPDNYQQDPRVVLAARTSPTNMGMALNAALAAHDFGWIDARSLTAWVRNVMEGMSRLERYRGHWLNWYEIRDLHRLEPAYVSTVDSGNLAVALVTLQQGLKEIESQPLDPSLLISGICDTLSVIAETVEALPGAGVAHPGSRALLTDIKRARNDLADATPQNSRRHLERWQKQMLDQLAERIIGLAEDEQVVVSSEAIAEFRVWLSELRHQIERARRFLDELMPWLQHLPEPGEDAVAAGQDSDDPWHKLISLLSGPWSLNRWSGRVRRAQVLIGKLEAGNDQHAILAEDPDRLARLKRQLQQSVDPARRLRGDCRELGLLAENWARAMDFAFLYDDDRHLFRIGFDVSNASPDPNYYDLLASEARLASLFAIAHGQVPLRHWVHLGRQFRRRRGRTILMSWGATLFEYLMPRLYARTPPHTLLDNACRTAIAMHREFAATHRIPWGISESGYYQLDEQHNYAYRAFGVPGLGFRRDLGERLVIAPYASIMALPYDPVAVVSNLRHLKSLHGAGLYGFFEAVDFGRRRKEAPRRARIVRSWMSHHQGMALLAIDNYLNNEAMVRRFHANPHVAGISMLLHERLPRTPPRLPARTRMQSARPPSLAPDPVTWPARPRPPAADYTVLSNGHLTTLINSDGGGGSWWQGIAIARWRPDVTTNSYGHFIYVRDHDNDRLFSITTDPAGEGIEDRQVSLGPHMAEFRCRQDRLMCRMRIAIAAQHDIEARRVLISNESPDPRRLTIAGFFELAMAPSREFERHPAFARLFVESECLRKEQALIFRRRPRSSEEQPLYVAHMVVSSRNGGKFVCETDRGRFVGRTGSLQAPAALTSEKLVQPGGSGAVIDPGVAAGMEIQLEPYGVIEFGFLTAVGRSRRQLLAALRNYRGLNRLDWLFEQARMQTSQELHHLQLPPQQVRQAMQMISATLEPQAAWRRPQRHQDEPLQGLLWSRGISGDWPIILVTMRADSGQQHISEIITSHTLLAGRQVRADLVIIDETAAGYEQVGRDRLHELSESIRGRVQRVLTGPVFILSGRELSAAQRQALTTAAALVLDADGPDLSAQIQPADVHLLPLLLPTHPAGEQMQQPDTLIRPDDLQFDNGYGGFSADGREYVIHLEPGQSTPAPWSNVIANPDFGTLVTESGSTFTWAGNSSEYRLTPWPNDPVSDRCGEIIYLRDEETGQVWTPTPMPRPGQGSYQIRHGAGRTVFMHHGQGLRQRLVVHVDRHAPVKLLSLELTNCCDWARRITATCYLEWVLGNQRAGSAMHLDCDLELEAHALLATNPFDRFARGKHAFVASSLPIHGLTTDRTEFLGQGGSVDQPAAMWRIGLSGVLSAGVDPCAALQTHLDIPPGETRRVVFVVGHGDSRDHALTLARRFASDQAASESLAENDRLFEQLLGRVQVKTPDASTNLLLNHWLPYQAISARLWGRTGYYQSSGGMGFRDQLQDAMAMTWLEPSITRDQILLAAARQFPEGDVLHWWHENPLRGVRTRCSDDLLWLPFVTAHYIKSTGDEGILDETIPYLAGEALVQDEAERYAEFAPHQRTGTLYEHCCRAIDRASTVGPNGLPVIGSGDWNDGFNRVSTTGRGESVWLAWFLVRVLKDFAGCCQQRADQVIADQYRQLAEQLLGRIEDSAWDGQWYRRAYYDDGTALGSADSVECRIDLIAQAWAVLAGKPDSDRSAQAMRSALEILVDSEDRLILLLDPPFDRTVKDPGYIKGYPPGIRENGAQYTHAATWAVWAAAALGWDDQAGHLFGLLDPIRRTRSAEQARHYRAEPYVLAGDIYSTGINRGRGGWSWYTGAASWMYRAGIEALLGLRINGNRLQFRPCLPPEWTRSSVRLNLRGARYDISIRRKVNADRAPAVEVRLDGNLQPDNGFELLTDGKTHRVRVTAFAER